MGFVALLDANVLVPVALCDTLLRAAEFDLYVPAWTSRILDEVERALVGQIRLEPSAAQRRVSTMREQFPEALVEGYEDLIPAMRNDEGDRHVLAGAVRVRASVIVTENVRHFPEEACRPYDIDVQPADVFLCHLWHMDPERMASVLVNQAESLRNPRRTPLDVASTLARHAPDFARTVAESGLLEA